VWRLECLFFAQVGDAVAELASSVLEDPGWPELLPYMFQCVQSNAPLQMECALSIFAQLAHYIIDTLRQYLSTLHGTLAQCLASQSPEVAVAAMRAATAFILVYLTSCMRYVILYGILHNHPFMGFLGVKVGRFASEDACSIACLKAWLWFQAMEDPSERQRFQDLLPQMLAVLAQSLNNGEELVAQEMLELFIELAESQPRFLRRNLQEVAAAMIQVCFLLGPKRYKGLSG
jgi:importin-5